MTELLENPYSWIVGVLGSMSGVSYYFLSDPFALFSVVFEVILADAASLFTAMSILGFTVAPEVPSLPEGAFQAIALVLGVIVVVKILDGVFDRIVERLT